MRELSDDDPPRDSKSPFMVASVHNVKRECQSVCLPMNVRFSGTRILHHKWLRVIHKENTVAYLLFSESTPTITTRQFLEYRP